MGAAGLIEVDAGIFPYPALGVVSVRSELWGGGGQVGVEIVIEYEDGSTETRTIDLISSSDTEV